MNNARKRMIRRGLSALGGILLIFSGVIYAGVQFPFFNSLSPLYNPYYFVIVSIVLYSLLPSPDLVTRLVYRVALIPVIAGISYELLRLSGKYRNSPVTKVLTAPGLLFQRLTTKEPSDDMLEVSIKAVQEASRLSSETSA